MLWAWHYVSLESSPGLNALGSDERFGIYEVPMNRTLLTFVLMIFCGSAISAQTSQTRASGSARSATAVSQSGKAANIQSGTQLAAQLENTLDVRKARVGDRVVLKTTEATRANGQTVVGKGARLIGHVTEVEQRTRANGQSRVGLVFDRLEKGSLDIPISATISSISQTRARAGNNDDLFGSDISTSSRSGASASRQSSGSSANGGLLGGVVNTTTTTVGSVAGNTTAAVGSTVGVVGNTTGDLTRSAGGIHITQSSNASADGGALLTLPGGNLRLEQGTSFHLVLSQAAPAGNNQ